MSRFVRFMLGALYALTLVSLPAPAPAQQDPQNAIIESLELEQADVREALKALFKQVGDVSYSIAPDVQGFVTAHLKKTPFETALQNVLKQVDATYRREGPIYTVIRRELEEIKPTNEQTTSPTAPKLTNPVRRIKIRSADPLHVMLLLAGNRSNMAPEMSTVFSGGRGRGGGYGGGQGGVGRGGLGGFGGGFGGGGFGGGFGGGGFGGGGFGSGGGGFGGGGFGGGGFGGGGFGGGGYGGGRGF